MSELGSSAGVPFSVWTLFAGAVAVIAAVTGSVIALIAGAIANHFNMQLIAGGAGEYTMWSMPIILGAFGVWLVIVSSVWIVGRYAIHSRLERDPDE